MEQTEVVKHEFLTTAEVADLLRLSVARIKQLCADPKSGFPRPYKLQRRVLHARPEVMEYLTRRRVEPKAVQS